MITDRATLTQLIELLHQQHRARQDAARVSIADAQETLTRARARLALSRARLAELDTAQVAPQETAAPSAGPSPKRAAQTRRRIAPCPRPSLSLFRRIGSTLFRAVSSL
jgi:hypothetical protein